MPLRTRLTLLMVLLGTVLCACFAIVLWLHNQTLSQRYHDELLRTQSVAWQKQQAEATLELRDAAGSLLVQSIWQRAWRGRDSAAMEALVLPLLRAHPHWRVDAFDAHGHLVYTSSNELHRTPMIDVGWVERTLNQQGYLDGLSQVARNRFQWVSARWFDAGGQPGVLALGQDVSEHLQPASGALNAQLALLNLRGHEVASTAGVGWVQAQDWPLALRSASVTQRTSQDGRDFLTTVIPLTGPDQRQVAALLALQDVSVQQAREQRSAWLLVLGVLVVLLGMGTLVFVYLRGALSPLQRSVDVLGALAQGDLRATLDDADEAQEDEAGRIARGVATLRLELLNLQMLRDERLRTRQQQERLIREQLALLAQSLDEDSRQEILQALAPLSRTGQGGDLALTGNDLQGESGNELAELASILGRLSGLVTTQQNRLITLLNELHVAMKKQALLLSLQQELEIARRMQLSILPRVTPQSPAVQVQSLMIPAKEIGGDFYDYFMVDEQHLALVVADVSGKGVPAAFFMAISRTLLKSNALFLKQPELVMQRLNNQLCAENEQMMFVTVFLGVLNLHTGAMVYVNAGHNPPLHWRADNVVEMLPGGRNMALAVMEELEFVPGQLQLAVGDTLVLYTDGVTEATNHDGALFGEAALIAAVHSAAGGQAPLPEQLLQAVRSFENGAPQADDITCVAVRYVGDTGAQS